MKIIRLLFLAAIVACAPLAFAPPLEAVTQPGAAAASTSVDGTIANVDGGNQRISIRSKGNALTIVLIAESTTVTRSGKTVYLVDLHAGDAVQASCFTSAAGELVATTVTATAANGKDKSRDRKRK